MKSFRRSRNGNRETNRLHISTPLPPQQLARPPAASLPPQKVIRAVASCSPSSPQQLPFLKGDFFYVIGDPDNDGAWYQAHNPVTNARGLVPKSMFEEISKNPTSLSRSSQIPSALNAPSSPPISPKIPKSRVFYAIVLHDFLAERADELDAKAGDPISVVAQSNREWFVAKPIGRLGRPGLIPATFVQLRDPATNLPIDDVDSLMDRGDLPKVEDWKKAMINYKQNSISLGVIEDNESSVSDSPFAQSSAPPPPNQVPAPPPPSTSVSTSVSTPVSVSTSTPAPAPVPRLASPVPLPDGILLSAEVVSFHYEMNEYWFRIDAIFQPYDPHDPHVLPKAKQLVLFRPYGDFYDFQVNLLENFPHEAGREPGSNRILPFMPGPTNKIDGQIVAMRQVELDQYIRKLCALNSMGASYILEHQLIRNFLSLKAGDIENDIEPRYDEISALFSDGGEQDAAEATPGDLTTRAFEEEVRDTLGEMKLSGRDDRSEGSDYGENHIPPLHPHSSTSNTAHQLPVSLNGEMSVHGSRSNGHTHVSRTSSGSITSHVQWPEHTTPSPSSLHSSQPSLTTRSRSHSTTATNLNAPPMSAGNSQIAFVKIKIFDRVTDDLIAIRVHPKVTHSELMSKVQARLGTNISSLRYHDSLHREFIGLEDDHDLRGWLENAEKHVLYAD